MSDFPCPKCGAALKIPPGTQMATCSYCGTVTYIDRSTVLFYYILPFTVTDDKARAIFRRWTAGPEKAKELETGAQITACIKEYFPVFRFRRTVAGREQVLIKPARGTVLPGMRNLTIPPGNLVVYDAAFQLGDAAVLQPDISIATYLPELSGTAIDQALVYFPIYRILYQFAGESYEIVLDGSSGAVYAGPVPGRSSVSYASVMALAFLLAAVGGFLMITVSLIFGVLILAGFFAGKILGTRIAQKPGVPEAGE